MASGVRFDTTDTTSPYTSTANVTGFNRLANLTNGLLVPYTLTNGDNWEMGWGHYDGTDFAVDIIAETWVDGTATYDDSDPAAISKSGTSTIRIDLNSASAFRGLPAMGAAGSSSKYLASGHIAQFEQSTSLTADNDTYIPFECRTQGKCTGMAVPVVTTASANAKVALYSIGSDGLPDKRLIANNTGGALATTVTTYTWDSSATIWVQPQWYYVAIISDGAPTLKGHAANYGGANPMGYSVSGRRPIAMSRYATGSYTTGLPDPANTGLTVVTGGAPNLCFIMA